MEMPTPGSSADACNGCALGKYADHAGQRVCSLCSKGKFADTRGCWNCSDCFAGYAQPKQGQATCDECKAGSYSNTSACTQCTLCEVGRTQGGVHAGYCHPCDVGTASSVRGSGTDQCPACTVGRYADSFGSSECKLCGSTRYSLELLHSIACGDCFNAEVMMGLGAPGFNAATYDQYAGDAAQCQATAWTVGGVAFTLIAGFLMRCKMCLFPAQQQKKKKKKKEPRGKVVVSDMPGIEDLDVAVSVHNPMSMPSTSMWLKGFGLESYAKTFEGEGYDDLSFFVEASMTDITRCISSMDMKPAHRQRFEKNLGYARKAHAEREECDISDK